MSEQTPAAPASNDQTMEAQRDHWLEIAREKDAEIERLRAELWTLAELIFHNHSSDDALHWARGIKVSIHGDSPPSFTHETKTGPDEKTVALVKEIYDRHGRINKLLYSGPPGITLGPMDADAAHRDRGALLSMLTPAQRGTQETEPPHPGQSIEKAFARSPRRVDPPGSYRDATGELVLPSKKASTNPADLVGAMQDQVHEDTGRVRAGRSVKASVRHLPTCNLNYIDSIGEGCDCGAENGSVKP